MHLCNLRMQPWYQSFKVGFFSSDETWSSACVLKIQCFFKAGALQLTAGSIADIFKTNKVFVSALRFFQDLFAAQIRSSRNNHPHQLKVATAKQTCGAGIMEDQTRLHVRSVGL